MKIKYFLQLIILFLCVFCFNTAKCADIPEEEAKVWVQNKGEQILKILADKNLEQKYKQLDEILYQDVDLDYAARFVVGHYWRKMTDEQKQKYVPLFKRYTVALYKALPLDVSPDNLNYEITKIQPNKNFLDVICSVSLNGPSKAEKTEDNGKIDVTFSLIKENGKIKVRDLRIAQSSLLISYRERFYKMIHQDSDDEIDWFLEDLESITQDKEAENELKLENQ